jgi:hypothetical protein
VDKIEEDGNFENGEDKILVLAARKMRQLGISNIH